MIEWLVPPIPTGTPLDVARWALDVHHRVADAAARRDLAAGVDAEVEQARAIGLASTAALVSIAGSLERIAGDLCGETKADLADVIPLRLPHPSMQPSDVAGVVDEHGNCLCICHRLVDGLGMSHAAPCCDKSGWRRRGQTVLAWAEGAEVERSVHRVDRSFARLHLDDPLGEPVGDGFPVHEPVRT